MPRILSRGSRETWQELEPFGYNVSDFHNERFAVHLSKPKQMDFDNKIDKGNELLKKKLLEANLDQMTPIEALNMLNMLKNEIKKKND